MWLACSSWKRSLQPPTRAEGAPIRTVAAELPSVAGNGVDSEELERDTLARAANDDRRAVVQADYGAQIQHEIDLYNVSFTNRQRSGRDERAGGAEIAYLAFVPRHALARYVSMRKRGCP